MNIQNDKTAVIAMPTLTYALQGEALLRSAGVYVRVIKLPAGATKKGCAYGLEIEERRLNEALRRIEQSGVRHGEVLY